MLSLNIETCRLIQWLSVRLALMSCWQGEFSRRVKILLSKFIRAPEETFDLQWDLRDQRRPCLSLSAVSKKVREKLSMDRAELRPCYKNHYSMVTIYDASSSFFVSKELAGKYVINITDIQAMCRYNANFAAAFDRSDLIQAWCLAAFGQNLIHSLIQHYAKQSDIQMAEMLSCAFSYRWENPDMSQSRIVSKSLNASILEEGGASDDYNENTSNFMEEVPIQYTDDISRQLVDVERTVAVE